MIRWLHHFPTLHTSTPTDALRSHTGTHKASHTLNSAFTDSLKSCTLRRWNHASAYDSIYTVCVHGRHMLNAHNKHHRWHKSSRHIRSEVLPCLDSNVLGKHHMFTINDLMLGMGKYTQSCHTRHAALHRATTRPFTCVEG